MEYAGFVASIEYAADIDSFYGCVVNVSSPITFYGKTIMDNLNVHKSDRIEAIIAARGAKCVFLPEYTRDQNPIEKMWSKVKHILRGIIPRSRQQLDEAIGKALEMVSPADAKGWFESCGYV